MKKILISIVLGIVILSVIFLGISCKEEAAPAEEEVAEEAAPAEEEVAEEAAPAEEAVREVSIVWDCDNLDESQNLNAKYMGERVAEINAERSDINITFEVTDAQNIVENQISSMETWLLKKPDIVIFTYVDAEALKPSVAAVRDAGIIVVDLRDMGDLDLVDGVFYGYHEPTYAAKMTEWLEGYLQDNPDVVLETGLLYGAAAQTAQFARIELVKDLAEKYPDRFNILVEAYGDWDTAKAMNITEDWMQAFPDMNYICSANSGMAIGVTNVLAAAGKIDDVLVTAVDLPDSGIQMLNDGLVDVLVGALNSDQGRGYINFSLGLLEGTYTEKVFVLDKVYAVDASNFEDFLNNTWDGKPPE